MFIELEGSKDKSVMRVSRQKDYLWNTLAGIINAAEVIVLSMIVTRFGQLSDAGILSLAFATANVLMAIGAFGGRMYQASDVNYQYTYGMYLVHRFLSAGLMVLVMFFYLGLSGYGSEKFYAVISVSAIYVIEVIENCIWGHYQLNNLLYVGARMFCTRWMAIFGAFTVYMIITRDMIKSLFAGAIAGAFVFSFWVIMLARIRLCNGNEIFPKNHDKGDNEWLISMTKQTFPLFVAGFCSLFINNIPKFAIDRYMNDEVQACYGFVAMPVFVIGLLNQFIYQPVVTRMSKNYFDGDLSLFKHNVNKQILEVAVLSAVCLVGAAVIGIPALSVVYDTDLSGYWTELVILQVAGCFLALSGFFNVILTIMRKQIIILRGYAVTMLSGVVIMVIAVRKAGTIGASVGYLAVMVVLFAYFFAGYVRGLKHMRYRED